LLEGSSTLARHDLHQIAFREDAENDTFAIGHDDGTDLMCVQRGRRLTDADLRIDSHDVPALAVEKILYECWHAFLLFAAIRSAAVSPGGCKS
jgi:hypothetical protein